MCYNEIYVITLKEIVMRLIKKCLSLTLAALLLFSTASCTVVMKPTAPDMNPGGETHQQGNVLKPQEKPEETTKENDTERQEPDTDRENQTEFNPDTEKNPERDPEFNPGANPGADPETEPETEPGPHPGEDHEMVYTWPEGITSCKDGVSVSYGCKNCDYVSSSWKIYNHEAYEIDRVDISELGGCHSAYVLKSCPCGDTAYTSWKYVNCHLSTADDRETCSTCGLTVTLSSSNETLADQCRQTTHYTYTIRRDNQTRDLKYDITAECHDYTWTWDEGITSCENGVTISKVCRNCQTIESTWTNYHHEVYEIDRVDLTELGGCGGTLLLYSCPCENEIFFNESAYACHFEWIDDRRECTVCGLQVTESSTTEVEEDQCREIQSHIYTMQRDGQTRTVEYDRILEAHHYLYSWIDGITSCEDGVVAHATCRRCGEIGADWPMDSHVSLEVKYMDLAAIGGCGGHISFTSCPCAFDGSAHRDSDCVYTTTSDSFYEGEYLINTTEYVCEICGMKLVNRWYEEKVTGECKVISHHFWSVYMNDLFADSFEYTTTSVRHNNKVTVALMEGSLTCEDGVDVTYSCRDCEYSSTGTASFHQMGEVGDPIVYDSVCGGYAVATKCACGKYQDLNQYEHANCSFSSSGTDMWIENTYEGQQLTSDGNRWFSPYACLYTCENLASGCTYTIRCADYWLPVEGMTCVIEQYKTFQFGYDSETGTFDQEITIATGNREQCHAYETDYSEEFWDGTEVKKHEKWLYTCSTCGSTAFEQRDYDENNLILRVEYSANNALSNGFNLSYKVIREYGAGFAFDAWIETGSYEEYIYADGTKYWSNREATFDGCTRTDTYTDSNGSNSTGINEHFHHLWDWVTESTCTQPGTKGYICAVCGELMSENLAEYDPYGHQWQAVEDHYECTRCGATDDDGNSGSLVLEDVTEKYNGGDSYIIGFWNRDGLVYSGYERYVAVILSDGEEVVLTSVDVVSVADIHGFSFSKSAVAAAAGAYAPCEIQFVFIPDNGVRYALSLG